MRIFHAPSQSHSLKRGLYYSLRKTCTALQHGTKGGKHLGCCLYSGSGGSRSFAPAGEAERILFGREGTVIYAHKILLA